MLLAARLLILSAIVLTGCVTAKTAAVKTFRVIDTPARFVRDRIDPPEGTTTTTTETTVSGTSDVVTPGRPVTAPPPPATTTQRTTAGPRPSSTPRPPSSSAARTDTASSNPQPKPSVAARSSETPATEFPTARPVPGKPGFVYSIDPKGGMVDVTGYKSGDKAKDPYTHQIFVVP